MAGFQIPIETKIDFLENGNVYGDKLETLIRSINFIKSLEEAEAELREERAEAEKERAFILQQQHAGTLILFSFRDC
jgi:hypothetical protein